MPRYFSKENPLDDPVEYHWMFHRVIGLNCFFGDSGCSVVVGDSV